MPFNPFQPIVAFHVETIHLICSASKMAGFYMKCNTGIKQVKKDKLRVKICNTLKNVMKAFRISSSVVSTLL